MDLFHTPQTLIEMLYSHWGVVFIVALFFFNIGVLVSKNETSEVFKRFKRTMYISGFAVIIIFAFMPVPQFIQSKFAIQGYVAQKSNQDSMFSFKLGAEDACRDSVVLGFEFMSLRHKFSDDVDRIIKQKSSFSMDFSFKGMVPVKLISGKHPICEFVQLKDLS